MQMFWMDILPTGDVGRPFKAVYMRSDRHGACPTKSFADWSELGGQIVSLGLTDHAVSECKETVQNGKTYNIQLNWRQEFESFWRE